MVNFPPPPSIPPIVDDELKTAVSALARAAQSYRMLLYKIIGDEIDELDEVARETNKAVKAMEQHEDMLEHADSVINAWREQLGIEHEEDGV